MIDVHCPLFGCVVNCYAVCCVLIVCVLLVRVCVPCVGFVRCLELTISCEAFAVRCLMWFRTMCCSLCVVFVFLCNG